ncbi:MAG TPA: hypothetical protein PLE72_12635, partial [Azospira sp.]|nr:hypothetical protein [Azospira sp.]
MTVRREVEAQEGHDHDTRDQDNDQADDTRPYRQMIEHFLDSDATRMIASDLRQHRDLVDREHLDDIEEDHELSGNLAHA